MKILAISDLHGKIHPGLDNYLKNNKIDLIVISGDITHFGPPELAQDLLDQMGSYNIPLIAIPGNCDPQGIHVCLENCKALNVHAKSLSLKNIGICGFGGSNPTPFDTPIEFGEVEIYEELDKLLLEMKDQDVKILITHAPPYNTQADKLFTGEHVGSKSIREIIEKYKPDLNICGHIHEAQSVDTILKTIVVNPGQLSDGSACLINIGDEELENGTYAIDSKFIKL